MADTGLLCNIELFTEARHTGQLFVLQHNTRALLDNMIISASRAAAQLISTPCQHPESIRPIHIYIFLRHHSKMKDC